jgi:hypothetical protein
MPLLADLRLEVDGVFKSWEGQPAAAFSKPGDCFFGNLELGRRRTVGGKRLGTNSSLEWLQCVTIVFITSLPDLHA